MFTSLRRNLGALTSKPYSFRERSWELRNVRYIDLEDSFGSFLNYEVKGNKVLKATPRINDFFNEIWISDKARFNIDGFSNQRLKTPVRCRRYHSRWTPLSAARVRHVDVNWNRGLKHLELMLVSGLFFKKKKNWPFYLHGVSGPMSSYDDLAMFKGFLNKLGSSNLFNSMTNPGKKNYTTFGDFRSSYFLQESFFNSELIILGFVNLRLESPIINIKLRALSLKNKNLKFLGFGSSINNNLLNYLHLGTTFSSFIMFLEGRHLSSFLLAKAKASSLLFGMNFLNSKNSNLITYLLAQINKNISLNLHTLNSHIGDISSFDLGFFPGKFDKRSYHKRSLQIRSILKRWGYKDKFFSRRKHRFRASNIIFSLGNSKASSNNVSLYNIKMYKHVFLIHNLIYQGSHGFNNFIDYDLLIPSKLPVESNYKLFTNNFGQTLELNKIITVNNIWSNQEIFSYLFDRFNIVPENFKLDNFLLKFNSTISYPFFIKKSDKISKNIIINRLNNYYITTPISENSWTMQKASKALLNKLNLNFK